jgi:outer membrane protein assembly factor BamB
MLNRRSFLATTLTATASHLLAANNWPRFRGPGGRGIVADNPKLPLEWSEAKNVAWKQPIPGLGWSSPVVWGDRIFLTSARSAAAGEKIRNGDWTDTGKPNDIHRWMLYVIDTDSGQIVSETELAQGLPPVSRHMKNTYATETCAVDPERAYAHFGHLGTYAVDRQGKVVWSKKWPAPEIRYGYGTAGSPVQHDGVLYIVRDNENDSALFAFDAATGREIWTVPRNDGSGWATPHIWQNDVRTEIVVSGKNTVRSYSLDGKELWHLRGTTSLAIPSPFSGEGLLFVGSGFQLESFRPLYAVRPGASGDITLPEGELSSKYIAWCHPRSGPYHPTPVAYQGRVYVLMAPGFFLCYDAKTGKEIYGKQRIARDAGRFSASPWAYNGHIFCLSEDGDTYVIQAGPEFKVTGKNDLDGMAMASPAIAQNSLYIRTQHHLYRIHGDV